MNGNLAISSRSQSDHSTDVQPRWQIDAGLALLLAVVTVATYWPALACDFVNLDDPKYVSENPIVAAGLSARGVAYACTTFDVGNWIPLTWMSYELQASLFGIRAQAFHAVNLVLHALNVVLLFYALRRMTKATGRSTAVALLFALHPLHVESVAWISEHKDVLSTFCLLLTLLAYERYALQPTRGRLAIVCLTMALGLLAKPMLVTLPILLLLVDIWPLRRVAAGAVNADLLRAYPMRTRRELLLEKMPLFALSLIDGIVTIVAQRGAGAISGTGSLPLSVRTGNAIDGCAWYLWKTVWPTELCAFYPLPPAGTPWKLVGLSALALVIISACVFFRRSRGHLVFGWLWFIVALLPVSGLVQVGGQAYADRYAYVPHIGLFALIVWEIQQWLPSRRFGNWLGVALCGAAAASCAMISRSQIATWSNSDALWAHALELDKDNYGAHAMLGMLRTHEHKWDEAEQHLRRVLVQRPAFERAIYHLGQIHFQREEWEQAEECFAWALRINPQDAEAASDLAALRQRHPPAISPGTDLPGTDLPGTNLPGTNRPTPTREAVDRNRQGLACARRGQMQDALKEFQEAIAIEPDYADAYNNAGLALRELKQFDEAQRQFRLAIVNAPDNADFHINLAALLVSEGAVREAREHYEAALRIKPSDVEIRIRLEQLQKGPGAR